MTSKKKVVYIISDIYKSFAFEWTAIHLKQHYDLSFILLTKEPSYLETFLKSNGIAVTNISYSGKKSYINAYLKILWHLIKLRPAVVHTHLYEADILGIFAAWKLRIPKRIYTRHNSTLYKEYFPVIHKLMQKVNSLATDIVSISKTTSFELVNVEKVQSSKVHEINHGFDFVAISSLVQQHREEIKQKYQIPENRFIVGSISRLVNWKGVDFIAEAFVKLYNEDPRYFLIMANASGPYKEKVVQILKQIPESAYLLIPFEENVFSLYTFFNVFVHIPVNDHAEAFGQTYIEAMYLKTPLVATKSGIGNEILKDGVNCLVVDYCSSEEVEEGVRKLANDVKLRQLITENAHQSVIEKFNIEQMIKKMIALY